VSNYDLQSAISLYFETGGVDLAPSVPTNPSPRPPVQRAASPPEVLDVGDFAENVGGTGVPENDIDEDEALARRLMQEDVDQAGPSLGGTYNDGVRSPIAARNDILVHPDMDYDTHYRGYGGRGRGILHFTLTILILGSSSRGIFNQATPSIWNEADPTQSLADATGGSSEASDKANRLAQMYRRPFELMHHVTLEEVVEISRHY